MFAGNVWAANGVGAVLAEKGRLGEAAEVLFAVQVSLPLFQSTTHVTSETACMTLTTLLHVQLQSNARVLCASAMLGWLRTAADSPCTHSQDNIAAADGLLPAPDVTLNVANVRLAQQDYYSAIQLYQACLRRHHQNKDATVLLYLARCAQAWKSALIAPCSHKSELAQKLDVREMMGLLCAWHHS